jgi:glucokinase
MLFLTHRERSPNVKGRTPVHRKGLQCNRRAWSRVRTIAAVDIGGTKISVAAVREDGTFLCRRECPTEPARGFDDAMERICRMLQEIGEAHGELCGIGVACAGPLDPATGIIGDVGTLPQWNGGNLIEGLKARPDFPIAVENDADAAALAEAAWGGHASRDSLLYVTISTGIGAGIILDGQLYRGVDGAHPEVGHHVIDPSGPLCYCRARGCWESLASGSSMEAWVRQHQDTASPLTAEEICTLAKAGNAIAIRAVERQGYYLGLGIANLVTIFAPRTIALGGGLMKSSSLFFEATLQVVRDICTQVPLHKTTICLASLGNDIGLLGAAQVWLSRFG